VKLYFSFHAIPELQVISPSERGIIWRKVFFRRLCKPQSFLIVGFYIIVSFAMLVFAIYIRRNEDYDLHCRLLYSVIQVWIIVGAYFVFALQTHFMRRDLLEEVKTRNRGRQVQGDLGPKD